MNIGGKIKTFEVIYCFVDENGNIEADENNLEIFYDDFVKAKNRKDAIKLLKKKENFKSPVEVVEVIEVKR